MPKRKEAPLADLTGFQELDAALLLLRSAKDRYACAVREQENAQKQMCGILGELVPEWKQIQGFRACLEGSAQTDEALILLVKKTGKPFVNVVEDNKGYMSPKEIVAQRVELAELRGAACVLGGLVQSNKDLWEEQIYQGKKVIKAVNSCMDTIYTEFTSAFFKWVQAFIDLASVRYGMADGQLKYLSDQRERQLAEVERRRVEAEDKENTSKRKKIEDTDSWGEEHSGH
jgi:hypothetical protein